MRTVLLSLLFVGFVPVLSGQIAGGAQSSALPGPPGPPAPGPGLELSLAMAKTALKACRAKGLGPSVTVVDSVGDVKVTLTPDGPHGTPATSVKKAVTAIHFKMSGADLEKRLEVDKALAAELSSDPAYNAHPGSLLLVSHGQILGAIALAGVPHEIGDSCLKPAVDMFQERVR